MSGRSLHFVLWLAAILALVAHLVLAISAFGNGEPPGPIEAAVLEQATRIAHGAPVFREPATGASVALMPGFPFVVSALVRMFDAQSWEPRFVCLIATLAAAASVAAAVQAETGSLTLGVASAGILLAGQVLAAGERLAAGPQPLLLLLALGGYMALRFAPGAGGAMLAALLMAGATFTHPAGLWFAFAALIHLAANDRRRIVAYVLPLAVLVGGGQYLLSRELGPWFNFTAWDASLLALRPEPNALLRFLGRELLGTFGVLTLSTLMAFGLPVRPWSGAVGIWTWMWFATIAAGAVATQSTAGVGETLMPALLALAIVGPVSIRRVSHHLSSWPGSNRLAGQRVVLAALALQFLVLLAHLAPALAAVKA